MCREPCGVFPPFTLLTVSTSTQVRGRLKTNQEQHKGDKISPSGPNCNTLHHVKINLAIFYTYSISPSVFLSLARSRVFHHRPRHSPSLSASASVSAKQTHETVGRQQPPVILRAGTSWHHSFSHLPHCATIAPALARDKSAWHVGEAILIRGCEAGFDRVSHRGHAMRALALTWPSGG